MKFNLFSFFHKKFVFEFYNIENVETEEVTETDQLLDWAERENSRMIAEDNIGSVLIVKRDMKYQILYALQLNLPRDYTELNYLLEKFYTKKKIKFDESILEDSGSQASQSVSIPPMPQIPEITPPPTSSQSEEKRGISEETIANYAEIPQIVTENSEENLSEIQQLIAIQNKQQEEIENLKKQLENERKSAVLTNEEKNVKEENENTPLVDLENIDKTNAKMNDSIETFGMSFQERMDQFLTEEKKKIEIEILATDNRSSIELEMKATIQSERESAIRKLELDLFEKQNVAMETEKKRHKLAIEKIEIEYQKDVEAKTNLLNKKYDQKTAEAIRAEYERQTKALKKIFDERMAELVSQQEELSVNMSKNIQSIFSHLDLELNEPKEPDKKQPLVLTELKQLG